MSHVHQWKDGAASRTVAGPGPRGMAGVEIMQHCTAPLENGEQCRETNWRPCDNRKSEVPDPLGLLGRPDAHQ